MADLSHLFALPRSVETRWATPENPRGDKGAGATTGQGRKGRPRIPLPAGEQVVLAEAAGTSGMVRRMWLTLDYPPTPEILRGLRLDIFWDGAATPAVSAPLGDFFGQGLGRLQTFESVFFSNPEGRSFNCCLPMPFSKGFRIVLTNESSRDVRMLFYEVDYTMGDTVAAPVYLHAHWRRENPTSLGRDFEILPTVAGRGRYLGANFSVITSKVYLDSWWGEGEVKVFLDGDGEHPTLVGTGTEDYIGTAWGQGEFSHQFQGCPVADARNGQYAFYRYHVPDPVYFQREARVTVQQIGGALAPHIDKLREAGCPPLTQAGPDAGQPVNMRPPEGYEAIFERQDDWASCCYFYLDRPENGLPPLATLPDRL